MHTMYVMYKLMQTIIMYSCATNLSSLSSAARSPVFSHLSSSLQGLWTIRAFGAEERFQKTFDDHQDLHSGQPQHSSLLHWHKVYLSCVSPVNNTFPCVEQRPGSCSWPPLVGSLCALMASAPSLLPSPPLAACCSETVRKIFWHIRYWLKSLILSERVFYAIKHLSSSSVRAGRWLCWFGSHLLCYTDGHVPVGCEAECRGGEHGEMSLFVWF